MRNIKLTIEYDGTNYAGWQVQPNGLAIQQVMEEALARILGVPKTGTSMISFVKGKTEISLNLPD